MVLTVWHSLVRAAAALLLLVAFVAPALAEVGCAKESAVHLQEPGTSSHGDLPTVSQDEPPTGEQEQEQAGHCAFSHGHCAGLASASARSDAAIAPAVIYDPLAVRILTTISPDAVERPPAA